MGKPKKAKRIVEAPEPTIKVSVSLASGDSMEAVTAYDLARLSAFSGATLVADGVIDLSYNMINSSLLANARNDLVKQAVANGSTHVLCIDSDMRFPKDALLRLLNRNKAVVGVNYPTRKLPPRWVAFKKVSMDKGQHEYLETTPASTGLEEVDAIGFGLILIRLDVFAATGYPAFETKYYPETEGWMGEDVYFSLKAREAGYKIYVDHDLSKEVRHVGRMEFRPEHLYDIEAMEAEADKPRLVLPGE